jgi:hypothetical protein
MLWPKEEERTGDTEGPSRKEAGLKDCEDEVRHGYLLAHCANTHNSHPVSLHLRKIQDAQACHASGRLRPNVLIREMDLSGSMVR